MSGYLLDGVWQQGWYDTAATEGRFERPQSVFHDWITKDGRSGFPAVPGRYHLYVSLACPWAHRTLIFRALKRLEDVISVSVVEPVMGEQGWAFSAAYPDHVNGARALHEIYTRAKADYSGRVTVPVLWDKKSGRIVSNESSEIIRMLNSAFDEFTPARTDYYPEDLRLAIDAINVPIYDKVNNGVYRCGFASSQEAYETAFVALFEMLDSLEQLLAGQRYLVGNVQTEADWRLFTTLLRFDAVYYSHFKCNQRRIIDYPNLSNYLRDLYQVPGIAATVNMDHIKRHYYMSHPHINPTRIVPLGPALDFDAPHDRAHLG